MSGGSSSQQPPPRRRRSPSKLFRIHLPKIMFCSPVRSTAVRPFPEDGKLRGDASPVAEEETARPVSPLRQRRQRFEHLVRQANSNWARYARWEESQGDLRRARDVWERAVAGAGRGDADVWIGYAEFEARRGGAADARRVWERAVAEIPSADRLWRRYAQVAESLGSYSGARQVFDRWTERRPGLEGWLAYVDLELRNGEVRRARGVFERLVGSFPGDGGAWARFAEFEARHGGVGRTRACYERGMAAVLKEEKPEQVVELVLAFAEFEERCRRSEQARGVYLHALECLGGDGQAEELRREYQAFERRCVRETAHPCPPIFFLELRSSVKTTI